MTRFIVRRLLFAIPLLFGIATITFFVIQLAPGDPMDMFLEQRYSRNTDPEVIELIRQKYGLDQPLHEKVDRGELGLMANEVGEERAFARPILIVAIY